ncbi:MAG: TolC family protein [Thermodesulfobacteriota bacterium]
MSSFRGLLRRKALPILLLSPLVVLGACNSATVGKFRCQTPQPMAPAVGGTQSVVLDPLKGPDHVSLSSSYASMTAANHRVKPSTTVTGKKCLNLKECRDLALANSLEIQRARIEEVSLKAVEYSNRTKLLPHFIFAGELVQKDNPLYSFSEVLGREGEVPNPNAPGTGVNNYHTEQERTTWRYALEARWSPTDAALAYYLTKNSQNDKRKAHYMKVRTAQKLMGVVESSYFRLLSLQDAVGTAQKLVTKRKAVLKDVENLLEGKLVGIEEFHRAKQKLVRADRFLAHLRNDAEHHRNLLASALFVSPEYCADGGFYLTGTLEPPCFDMKLCDMEMVGIKNRPEAFKAGLDHINSINDLKKTVVKFFPKVTGYWRYTEDQDKHHYRKDWKDIGMMVYFDLSEWASNVWDHKASEWKTASTQRDMGLVALGITSQVRSAALKYYDALDQLKACKESAAGSRKVLGIQRERTAKESQDKLGLSETEADLLQHEAEAIRALGEAHATLAELKSAMGSNYQEPHVK